MKRSLIFGFSSALIGGLLLVAAAQFTSWGRETNSPPQFKLEDAPLNREAHGLTSYAPIIKRAAPSVVNIYSTRTIRERQMDMNPFFNDPLFRRFFGPEDEDGMGGNNNNGRRPSRRPHSMKSQSLGSGVVVSADGYILTANHVVEGADEIKVAFANGGKEYTAKVIGTDAPTDVAILKIDARDVPSITIADSDKLEVGDVVLAIGNPFGVGQTVTMGIVSGVGRTALGITEYEDFIQTDAAINPGNSGGALVDAEGRLIGINTAIFSRSGGYQGVGFAVPVNMARSVMERLIKYGKVTRGYLGVDIQTLTPELSSEFDLPDQSGALVTDIRPGTPAARAGVQTGDVIRTVNGKKIADSQQLRLMISQAAPGTRVTLTVLRSDNGKKPIEKTLTATLGTLPVDNNNESPTNDEDKSGKSSYDSLDGVEVTDIDQAARRQFNIPAGVRGALVTTVDSDSNAAEAGLREGDIIQEINRQPVRNADDAVKLSDKAVGDRVLLRVWRQTENRGGTFFITVDNKKRK